MGQSIKLLYPDGWQKTVTYYRDEILAGHLERFEATRVAKDGSAYEVWISCAPIRGADGDIIAISNIHRDVSEVRNAEMARDLIVHEVIHRAKNMVGIVVAIQRQTARIETTVQGFMRSFEGRLRSLSHSTDLLVKSAWTSVDLTDLVNRHLELFVDPNDKRHTVSGPKIRLQPQCVQAIGMAFHELAINSAEYGALTQSEGWIKIVWSIANDEKGPKLHLTWHEGGIVVEQNGGRKGFGSTVLTSIAPTMIDASPIFEKNAQTIKWTIAISSEHFDLQ